MEVTFALEKILDSGGSLSAVSLLELMHPLDFSMVPDNYFLKVDVISDEDVDKTLLNSMISKTVQLNHQEKKQPSCFYSHYKVDAETLLNVVVIRVGLFDEM